ncbi:hypothetical protein BHQ20_29255 [Mycobacterium intermedium]|nr:hypothetical protein BHQ20_29255 [Mycobacterium intermedium]
MTVALLRELFEQLVVAKNAELIEHYYDPDFVMFSDGLTQGLAEFRDGHRKLFASPIEYSVEYDDQAWVQDTDKQSIDLHKNSFQAAHQLRRCGSSAEQGAVHGGGIVHGDGLAGEVEAVADRFLEPASVVKAGTGRVERVGAQRVRVDGPARRHDLHRCDICAEELPSNGQRGRHQFARRGVLDPSTAVTGVECQHNWPRRGGQGEPLRPHSVVGTQVVEEGVLLVPGASVEAEVALGQRTES